jgi:hypothetical protein
MKATRKIRKPLFTLLLIVLMLLVLSQLQPWLVERAGGVAGSFGVRPLTHVCFGVTYENGIFPPGEIGFTFLWFHFRYFVTGDDPRPLCVGQDIWFGE